jgi:chemosensory pili system protein ChpA (sensor histidine kinase/response regulator)
VSEQVSPQLLWVTGELAGTLRDARVALEEFAEHPEQAEPVGRCAELLHQAHGALRMAEIYGASLLAEEMEQLALHLHRGVTTGQSPEEGLDALSRAIVQLPPYLERVATGGRDIPLVLLPLLNDLRAARGSALLSENTLLLLNLPSDQHLLARGARPHPSGEDLVALARQLRPRYQVALLAWIRGERPDSSLAVIADVAAAFERAATEMSVYQLWWVLGGVVEALRQGGLPASAAIKRLLGQVDRQIRRLIDEGEAGVAAAPPVELLNSLLFYVARSSTRGSRVSVIRDTFSLGDLLPDLGDLADARDSLGGPSVALMHTVASAIREDLGKVKDTLDLQARTGNIPPEVLDSQFDMLCKIGDTLGVLGLGDFRDEVQTEAQRLRTLLGKAPKEAEEELLAVAAALLRVEDRLDGRLVGLVVEEPAAREAGAEDQGEAELQQVRDALLRECLINMARVRDAINERLSGPIDPQLADHVPDLLRAVTAALLMLEFPRAVAVLERITTHVRKMIEPGAADMRRHALDRLADAIVSVEYFMETVRAGRKSPVFMLENAETCLDAMPRLEPELPEPPELPEYAPVETPPDETIAMREVAPEREPERPLQRAPSFTAAPPAEPAAPVYAGEERPDPELIELFIEEAKELEEVIRTRLPAWVSSADTAELGVVRRAFHTIKGSGRMVGAKLVGEYAWSIERLMNALLEQRVERTEPVVQFLERAVTLLPALIEQLESGRAPETDVQPWIVQASAFAESRPNAAETFAALLEGRPVEPEPAVEPEPELTAAPEAAAETEAAPEPEAEFAAEGEAEAEAEAKHEAAPAPEPEREPEPEPAAEPEPARSEMDPVLRDIFTREASGHLDTLRAFIEGCALRTAPYAVTEDAHRATHTLAGSANMADVVPAVAVARPLNEYLRRLYDDHVGLPEAGLALVRRAVEVVQSVVEALREGLDPGPGDERLAAEIRALHEDHQLRAEAGAADMLPEEEHFDPDILELFCEEAAEILEEAQVAMASWRAQPRAAEPLRALQRHLHTIKGSARLAGVRTIGDFSHDLENLFEALADGSRTTEPGLIDVVQHCLDAIHNMRDVAAEGHMPAVPPGLHERLAAALAGEALAEEAPIEEAPIEEMPVEEAPVEAWRSAEYPEAQILFPAGPPAGAPAATEEEPTLLLWPAGMPPTLVFPPQPLPQPAAEAAWAPEPEPEPEQVAEPEPEAEPEQSLRPSRSRALRPSPNRSPRPRRRASRSRNPRRSPRPWRRARS